MKNLNLKSFIIGFVLCAILLSSTSIFARPVTTWRSIDVAFGEYKVMLDGVLFEARDGAGNHIELFNFDGWIFAPFEHIAEALGMSPSWDGDTHTLYLTSTNPLYTPLPASTPTPQPNVGITVFWTTSGTVYHRFSSCRSLANSMNIQSGTISQSGKANPCGICW
jgi:hypothetical protein